MNIILKLLLAIGLSVLFLAGCYNMPEYSGDGHLIDNGVRSATDRYVLNLGEIDLSQRGTKTYRFMNLPEEGFVAGIEIRVSPKDRSIIERREIKPIVLLELSAVGDEVVFMQKERLDMWTWSVPIGESTAFIYGRGEPGTYFQPLPHVEYTLAITVLQPDPGQLQYTASLLAKSGGWK